MRVFAISDLHLSTAVEKPMDIFGDGWQNHFEKICEDWQDKVADGDLVLLGGDMSWGITIEEATPDYQKVAELKGKKFVVKGNHDYYWNSLSKMRLAFPDFTFVQNNAFRMPISQDENAHAVIVCGTRGWTFPLDEKDSENTKIYQRELQRLTLSLDEAKKLYKEGDIVIALLHYPPFDAEYKDSDVTKLLDSYNVNYALYGHLHGKGARVTPKLKKNNTEYILTSCDLIDNKLVEVCEIN